MLIPSKYWRIDCDLDVVSAKPSSTFLLPDSLGSVRKVMSQTPHRTGQRDHRSITSCKLVEAGNDSSAFLQPAEHTFNDVALPVLETIKEPR